MAYEVEAFGKIIEVPDDIPKQEAYKQIMANRHKLDPDYVPEKSGIGSKLNDLAAEYLAVDKSTIAKAFTPTPSIADQAEASANEGENTAAPQVPGAPVRQSTYNQALLDPNFGVRPTEPFRKPNVNGVLDRTRVAANDDIKGQADQQELELLRTEALKPSESGFTASALNSAGRTIKGAGQVGSDFLGADKDNAITQYGQKLLDNNPLWVNKLGKIEDEPFLAFKEATGNSVPSMAAMVGIKSLGIGIASLAPLTGPAAPIVAAVGGVVQWLGPAAVAALPSYSSIRDSQILKDPKNEADAKSKAIAALGASVVGAIEVAFGPQQWVLAMLTKEGRAAMARKFASTTIGEAAIKGGLVGGLTELSEELVQSPIEQLASYEDPTTKKNLLETAHGGAMGFLGGSFPGAVAGAASQVSQQANIDRLKPIADAPTVDDAIAAAHAATTGKPVTKEDVLRTVDPTLADIEALTGVKPNETQATIDAGQAQAAKILDIVLPDNSSVKAQWKIVDADQLDASMKEDVNQPRDRTRAASDVQIKSIANAPDYRRLSDSPVMDVGAPVVDQAGRIVAGNGRFAGLSQAYEQGTATEYLNQLREDAARKGLSIEGINKPVLVRQLAEPVDTRKLAIASNSGTTLQMSALEQAKLDAERMKGIENLDVNDLGDIALTPRNLTQLKDSLGTYTSTELGSLVDKGGQLSQEGVRRVRNAMLAKAYGSSPVLEKLVESTDSDMRNVLGALTKSANHIISTKGDVKPLMEAVDTYAQLKATGQPVDNFLAQQDAFSEGLTKEAEDILRFIDTNVRSQKKLTDFIKGNFREVDTTSADMFESNVPVKLYRGVKKGSENVATVGDGLFYSPDRKVAEMYAGKDGKVSETSRKFDKLLSAKNWVEAKEKVGLGKADPMSELVNVARSKGYDGIAFNTTNGVEYIDLAEQSKEKQLEKHLKDNGYDFTVEPASVRDVDALDSTKKARKELAEKQAKLFKKKVVFVKADGPFSINGVMVPNIADTIFVDIRTAKPFDAIMAHELSHWMEQEKPAVYKQMVKSLKQVIKDDATEGYAKKYGIEGATKSEITKEIAGDIMGDNFTQQSFWDKVAAANPEAFKDIAAAIIKWLKGIIVKAKANGMGSEQWVKDATKAQDIVAKAVAQYTESEATSATKDGGVKFNTAVKTVILDGVERPIENSEGKPINNPVNFWRWFGDDANVDDQGRPRVLYHSTLADVTEFNPVGKFMGYSGTSGISLTDNKEIASRYLDRYAEYGFVDGVANQPFSKNVMPVYVKIGKFIERNEPFRSDVSFGAPLPKDYIPAHVKLGYDTVIRDDSISRKGATVKHSEAKNALRGKEYIVSNPNQIKSAIGNNGEYSSTNNGIQFSRAYHGSPHDHNKFDSNKIGTGEGAQAYGYGHYFAESKDVAEFYRKNLSNDSRVTSLTNRMELLKVGNDKLWDKYDIEPDALLVDQIGDGAIDAAVEHAEDRLERWVSLSADETYEFRDYASDKVKAWTNLMPELKAGNVTYAGRGKLYEVELAPEQDEYLLWDKPLSEQSDKVKSALGKLPANKVNPDGLDMSGGSVIRDNRNGKIKPGSAAPWVLVSGDLKFDLTQKDVDRMTKDFGTDSTGENIYSRITSTKGSQKAASEYLHSLGIRGIKYLDGSSRAKGEGAYNYVIFDDKDVSITAKFSKAAVENTLIAQHNLSVRNLIHADRMGGLAAPSIAVTDKAHPLTGFGEITLLSHKDLIDPKNGTKIFGSDIYSPRYPSISYDFSGKPIKALNAILAKGVAATGDSDYYNDNLQNDPFRELVHSSAAMYMFLSEQGKEPDIAYVTPRELPDQRLMKFVDDKRDSFDLSNDDEFKATAKAIFADKSDRADTMDEQGLGYITRDYANQVVAHREAIRNAGKVDRTATNSKLFRQISDSNLRNKFDEYLVDLVNKVEPKERIFKGYTNAGNRQYMPHDIDTVIKILKKDLRGGENSKYGLGSIRAKYSPQFKSIEHIRKSKGMLMDSASFDQVKKEVQAGLDALNESLASYGTFSGYDNVETMLSDAAKRGISGALKDNGFENVPDDIKVDIQTFLNKLKDMPTEYFEAKILRAVGLGEFSTAIIPDDATPQVEAILKKNGIEDIRKYKAGDNEDRVKQINKVTHVMFSRAPKLYSKLEQALEAANDKIFSTGPQVKLWLQSNAGKMGIKKDEIYWSGIDNWLDAQGKVDKQQVVEFVRQNGVKVEDVTLKTEPSKIRELDDERTFYEQSDDGKWYVYGYAANENDVYDTEAEAAAKVGEYNKDLSDGATKHNNSQLTLPGGTDYKELVVTVPTIEPHNADDTTHFGDTGQGKQIGWLRMDTRDGGLFIEELQSQRAQQGRSKGFGVVPPAPFVSDANNKATNAYVTLLMKKALIEAVSNDHASVSWTTGNQQADRYDLSKQVDTIDYRDGNTDGTYEVSVRDEDGNNVIPTKTYTVDELSSTLGKDIAKKIENDEGVRAMKGWASLSGLDLKTGGEWAQSMYGNEQGLNLQGKPSLMSQAANDIFKHVGSGKVENINGQPGFYITPEMKSKDLPLFSKEPSKPMPPEETRLRRFQRMNQDSFNRFTVIKEWLAENGQTLSDKADVYGAEERYHSMAANQLEDFREQQRNPLIEKIQKAGYTLGDIEVFLKMQHAQEANAQIRKLGDNPDATAYGIDDQEAADYLTEAPKELATLANEFRDITEQTKKLRLDAGILNTDITDAWEGAYQHYVPVKGEADSTRGVGKGLKTNFKSKRRLGHSLRDEHVIENILMDHERAIMEVERNRVGKHLVMMAAEMQRPDILSIDQPEKRKMLKESTAYTVEANGVVQGVFKSRDEAKMFKQFYAASMPKVAPSAITINQTKDQRVIASASPMLAENEVNVYMNGHAIRVQINDELLARAYTKMGVEQFSDIVAAGRILNGYLSKVYTGYNPEFILTNMIRDFSSGMINLTGEQGFGMATKALTNYPRMFTDLLKYAATNGKSSTKWIDAYRKNGGNTGAAYLSDMERLGQEVSTEYASYQGVLSNLKQGDTANAARAAGRKVFNATLKWIYNLNQAGENAMRLAAFKAMIDSGRTVNEAAKVAKNITVNFNRKGERQWAPALYLFYNASLQGTAATGHALGKGKHKGQAWALAGSMAAVGYMMAASFGGGSEDDWDEINDYTKERNVLIKSGDGYVKVPVPYGYGFFWNLGRNMADAQRTGEWGKMPWHLATSAISEFTPFNDVVVGSDEEFRSDQVFMGFLPTAMKIVAQPVFNKQLFTGSELMPESQFDKSQPDRQKMFRSTKGTMYDEVAGWLDAAGMDVSPETLKYITRTGTGGAGSLVDTTISAAMLKSEGAELDTQEIPFVRKDYMELGIKDKRAAYYKVREEARTAAEEFNRARRDNDVSKMQTVLKDKKELIALDRYANKLAATIDAARDQQDAVRADKNLSVQEKRLKLKDMEATEAKFYDKYLDVFKATSK